MPKKFFQRYMPNVHAIREHPRLQFLGPLLHDPRLWHLHRRPIAGGVAVGLFCAFIPIPMQMLLAAVVAIHFRVNLPIAVTLIWLTNPITIPPVFYLLYAFGSFLLGRPLQDLNFEFSLDWLMRVLDHIWLPTLLGTVIVAPLTACLGYWLVCSLWRYQVIHSWHKRREKLHHKLAKAVLKSPIASPTHSKKPPL